MARRSVLLQALTLTAFLLFPEPPTNSFPRCSAATGNATDALLTWKFSLESPSSLFSWNASNPPCNWFGISCDNSGTITGMNLTSSAINGTLQNLDFSSFPYLTTLDLGNNSLSGTIPSSISNLSKLYHLGLYQNQLSGALPEKMSTLKSLIVLDLRFNTFSGSLPPWIGNLTNLQYLHLYVNGFSGSIPSELGFLKSLKELFLNDNQFTGSIPPSIGNLTSVVKLWLSHNQLSGSIPWEIGRLNFLAAPDFSSNYLNGSIPASVGNITDLQYLFLQDNRLSGAIPSEVANCRALLQLLITTNSLTDPLPSSMGNFSSLQVINLRDNYISGRIPPEIGAVTSLQQLSLTNNRFSGYIPEEITNLTNLAGLQISGNNFTGRFPPQFCTSGVLPLLRLAASENFLTGPIPFKNCTKLERVRLENNRMTGNLSEDMLGTYPSMDYLELSNNRFYGEISPRLFEQFVNLTTLKISNNALSGVLPPELGNMTTLQLLDLSWNNIVGEIPETLGKQTSLIKILLDGNMLSGEIPSSIGDLSKLDELNLANNNLSGEIPAKLGQCLRLLTLNLSNNKLSGHIPAELGKLPSLQTLDLSGNSISGDIPDQIGELSVLHTLNLSHNKLSGPISVLAEMSSLITIDISYNHLEGRVPNTTAFRNATLENVRNNSGLCGEVIAGLVSCPSKSKKKELTWVVLISVIAAGIVVVLILSVGVIILFLRWLRKRNAKVAGVLVNNENLLAIWSYDGRIAYETIIDATEGFDDKYCIGRGSFGSVYKASLPTDKIVAVKKFHAATPDMEIHELGRRKAFKSEINALTEIRHRNIVRLYGFCSTPQHCFVVYEYLESGSLHSLLEDSEVAAGIGWLERVKVVKDVAGGLSYLHHDCSPPIIHRDISSKNILLDVEYEAHLSDFGTARFLLSNSSIWTSFAGTFGYAAPELAYMTKVNEKCDVYSFGMLALETLAGKHPGDLIFSLSSSSPDATEDLRIKDVLDQRIPFPRSEAEEEEVMSVLKIAFACLNYQPLSRPTMKHVLQELSGGRTSDVAAMSEDMKLGEIVDFRGLAP